MENIYIYIQKNMKLHFIFLTIKKKYIIKSNICTILIYSDGQRYYILHYITFFMFVIQHELKVNIKLF